MLRLMFICCHPALSADAQTTLTLKLVGGLSTEKIARSFLTSEADDRAADRARQADARRGRAAAGGARRDERAGRLTAVLGVIYLLFNEGYSATAGDDWMRPALCDEAVRLGRILSALVPTDRRRTD